MSLVFMRTARHLLPPFALIALICDCKNGGSSSSSAGARTSNAPEASDASPISTSIADAAPVRATPSGCASADPFVYLIGAPPSDHARVALHRFAPESGRTERLAGLACDPFSIAVDRTGAIWAAGHDHKLYAIDRLTGACHATAYAKEQLGFDDLHLAFASDPAAKRGEVLYASDEHYDHGDPAASKGLASIDLDTLRLASIGRYEATTAFADRPCDVVGTGDGHLFAQCSGQELWRVAPKLVGSKVPLSRITSDTSWLHLSNTRPFAFSGGSLWFFGHPCDSGNCDEGSHVTRFDIARGVVRSDVAVLPIIVSAATSSTCAPL